MATKKEMIAQAVAKAVGAGKPVAMETVDFSDPNRPKTCLEVDFPILPVNQIAVIEGNAGKPIYQMSKWWARRRSSVFRAMLIAAATKAPDDQSHAAKMVWDNYYANHQKKGAFKHLKVADIFMGGGTTLVEGSRLGMQMIGNDLNPVAWFVVKQELAQVDLEEVQRLLAEIEAVVRPQIIPFYYCDGPNGEKGTWTHLPTGRVEGADFDPLALTPEQRPEYRYEGPEIIYTFWAKHGPCQVTGCGHRTPIMSSPVMAVKTLTVKRWDYRCRKCGEAYVIDEKEARMAPDVPLYVAPSEAAYCVLDPKTGVVCPHCGCSELPSLDRKKATNKKVELSLLVHPEWLAGSAGKDEQGRPYGGSAQDDAESTAAWCRERASHIRLLEVRGKLPEQVTCPETDVTFQTGEAGGTSIPQTGKFSCAACGTVQRIVESIEATQKTAPSSVFAVQGHSGGPAMTESAYRGRFFSTGGASKGYEAAAREWEMRKSGDLADYWPSCEIPFGHMTHQRQPLPRHGYTHWWTMFNPRQLLVHAQLLKAITSVGDYGWETREYVLGAFQNYLRNQCMFAFWHVKRDHFVPALSNNNFHPKSTLIEVGVFSPVGYGPWSSAVPPLSTGREWSQSPWDAVSAEALAKTENATSAKLIAGRSERVYPGDPVGQAELSQGSSTDFQSIQNSSLDLVITDPPFGGLLHYSELSDFFYVWLRLALKDKYPNIFTPEYTPKSLEAVANKAREPEDPDGFYQRLLTQCWREAHRILKPGGILAFTFHHSEDKPWISVLESLFDAGFYLEATYPIRSDETKGDGEFGSKTIEYDIIHVCRKRNVEPQPVSWARLRRAVMADVRQVQGLLENHSKGGLPAADVQVIRRGKALEYFSRHYGKVYLDEGKPLGVQEALLGINQLLEEDADRSSEPPPVNCEPMTRQFLRYFDKTSELKRDQLQKFLRGNVITPDDFVQLGWCTEKKKVFYRAHPLDVARDWSGKHKRRLTSDLDQALVLIGACFPDSGINAQETLKNENFKPHQALNPLLEWLNRHDPDKATRQAASRALTIFQSWQNANDYKPEQIFLEGLEE